MRTRTIALVFAMGLLLLFGLTAAACNDDGSASLTLEEYFTLLDEADDAYASRSGEIDEASAEAEDQELLDTYFPQYIDAFEEFVSTLDDINPPDEVTDEHEAVVSAADEFQTALSEAFDDSASIDEFLEATRAEPFAVAEETVLEACTVLQGIADENAFDISLNC